MAITETRIAAYITGVSFAPNLSERVDVSGPRDGSEIESRYYCVVSATFETQYDTGEKRPEQVAQQVRLIDPDTGRDYRLTLWDVPSIIAAIPNAISQASAQGKEQYAGYAVQYPTYKVTEE